MKRLWFSLVALLFAGLVVQAQPVQKPASTQDSRPTVVCLGDSITRAGYPAELEKLIAARVINAGVGGNNTREGLARLEKSVLTHKPNVVVLFFGANDSRVLTTNKHIPPAQYEENLALIVDRCLEAGAKVVLGTMPPINPTQYFLRYPSNSFDAVGGIAAFHAKYREAALRVAKKKGVASVDLNQLLAAEPDWQQADGVHPTPEGTKAIARIVSETVATLLQTGVGAKPIVGAEVLFDGSREMLDARWTYWEGPRFASSLPIKWKIVEDPVDQGTVLLTHDPAAAGGNYGAADIVTKKAYEDFRLHVEFCVMNEGGNSGVYLQNRYEIQICDGDKTRHGMATVINDSDSPYHLYKGLGKWNAYDINFRAARFKDGKLVENALATVYFNGVKVHTNHRITQVVGGANSGVDGGNDDGKGITGTPAGLKLQNEGHDVRYRNIWIKETRIEQPATDF